MSSRRCTTIIYSCRSTREPKRSGSCVSCKLMYELIQHTADIRIRVEAPTRELLFRDALRGLMDYIGGGLPSAAGTTEIIEVDSVDVTALLVDFLNDALLRSHLRRLVFTDAEFTRLTETELEGTLRGSNAGMAEDVKAVTYHEADVRLDESGSWVTTIVL